MKGEDRPGLSKVDFLNALALTGAVASMRAVLARVRSAAAKVLGAGIIAEKFGLPAGGIDVVYP